MEIIGSSDRRVSGARKLVQYIKVSMKTLNLLHGHRYIVVARPSVEH